MLYFKVFFKVQKLAIFGRFKAEVKMHFLAIFLNLCVVVVILNMHVKDDFNWPSRISPRVMWICLSFRLNSVKTTILLFLGFLKIKNSRASFRLIFENSLPKGFSCQSMKKSVISVLKINSRYLQYPGFNISSRFNHFQKLTANYALFTPAFSVTCIGDIFVRPFGMLCNLAHIKMITQRTLLLSNSTFSHRRWIYLTSN